MKRLAAALLTLSLAPAATAAETIREKAVLSEVYPIDRVYRSMEGPQSTQNVYLGDPGSPELVWLIGVKTEMMMEDGETATLPEFMCHVNVDFDSQLHRQLFGWQKIVSTRLVTLSQGQLESFFPAGFGMPLLSTEPITLTTQVLNLNFANPSIRVRHRVTFYFARDCELGAPMQPLYNSGIFGMALVEGPEGILPEMLPASEHGASCLMRPQAPNAMGGSEYRDRAGRKFTGHWVVKPGREENVTDVTELLALPFDTKLHHAAVHLHPFAESLELRDATAGTTVFMSIARGPEHGYGLTDVSSFASAEGVPLLKDHRYELVSVYNNTSGKDADSMAVMYLGVLDKEFRKPAKIRIPVLEPYPAADAPPPVHVVFETVAGEITAMLNPTLAPKTVAQFVKLVEAGVYDGVRFHRLEPGFVLQAATADDRSIPLREDQRAVIQKIPLEVGRVSHERGALSMAHYDDDPDSAETSFSILLGPAPHLDGNYTLCGMVESGWETLETIESAPRKTDSTEPAVDLRIIRARVVR